MTDLLSAQRVMLVVRLQKVIYYHYDLQSRLILAFKAKVALMRASLHLRFVSRFLMTLSQLQDSFMMDG